LTLSLLVGSLASILRGLNKKAASTIHTLLECLHQLWLMIDREGRT
jgi:hypothetical protein